MIALKSTKSFLCFSLSLGLLFFILTGCAELKKITLPWMVPVDSKFEVQSEKETQELVKALEDKRQDIKTIAMKGGAHVVTPQDNLYGDHLILAQAPGQLRAEVFGPFGRPVLVVVCNGVFLTIMDYQHNRAFKGAASKQNMSKFLGLDLTPSEIYATLIGCPSLQGASHSESRMQSNGKILLTSQPAGKPGWMNMMVDPETKLVLRAWYGQDEKELTWDDASMRVVFREYTSEKEALRIPLQLALDDDQGREVELLHNEVKINPELPEGIFNFEIPKGIKVIPLH